MMMLNLKLIYISDNPNIYAPEEFPFGKECYIKKKKTIMMVIVNHMFNY